MRRTIVIIASAAINAFTISTVASECTLSKDVNTSRTRRATLRIQPNAADDDKTCRAYASSFDRSVMLRQAGVTCVDSEPNLAGPESEINAFNNCWRRSGAVESRYSLAMQFAEVRR